jgi:hypothetical protein
MEAMTATRKGESGPQERPPALTLSQENGNGGERRELYEKGSQFLLQLTSHFLP